MSHWRAENERLKCQLREVELMKIEGECLLSKDLYITMGATYASLASGLIRFPYNAGPYVTGFTEVHEVIRILEDEITGLLTAFFGTEYLADDFLPKLIRETPIQYGGPSAATCSI